MPTQAKGLLIVVTGPSAVGKGTICQTLLQDAADVRFSVSCTTRAQRPGETNGVEYFFLTKEAFQQKASTGDLLEWAEVYGNYYGTPRSYVEEVVAEGNSIILDIDMAGARSVRQHYPDALFVCVIPPSMESLRQRIAGRGTDAPEAVQRRLEEAPKWIEEGLTYDYVIVNDKLDAAVTHLRAIIMSEKSRTARQGGVLIRQLLEKGVLDCD